MYSFFTVHMLFMWLRKAAVRIGTLFSLAMSMISDGSVLSTRFTKSILQPASISSFTWSSCDGLYYVGADAKQSGTLQGELAVDAILADSRIDRNKDGKIQYVVLEGEPGHQDAIIRTESAVNTLKDNGIQLEKLGYGIAN